MCDKKESDVLVGVTGDNIILKPEVASNTKKLGKLLNRTGFPVEFLSGGLLTISAVLPEGQLQIKHPNTKRKPVVHSKFFERVKQQAVA
jgi:hypothetical protein